MSNWYDQYFNNAMTSDLVSSHNPEFNQATNSSENPIRDVVFENNYNSAMFYKYLPYYLCGFGLLFLLIFLVKK